jgi:AcrR family transcriptional regulator
MSGARERARTATVAEIVERARQQVADSGPAALSLRAIARDMEMVSSGIYRYFPSRDDLLTVLIIDSYDRLGAACELADRNVRRRHDWRARWRAVTLAIRDWAVENPSEYSLLFGTPVPGYAAPQDTIGPASRYTLVLLQLLVDLSAAGVEHTGTVPRSVRPDLARLRQLVGGAVSDATMLLGLTAWSAVMGAVSLELFGHLHNVVDEPGALFFAVVEQHGALLLGE